MNSDLFGSGVAKFIVSDTEYSLTNSFIESIIPASRTLENESIINANRNWVNIADYDHLTITVLVRLHKETSALETFKTNYYAHINTEVDAFHPSATAEPLADKDGAVAKFYMQITDYFPLESPWYCDTLRMVFKSKKPINLNALTVAATGDTGTITDTDGSLISDTDGSTIKD